jgi:hypothetical protein
MAGPAASAATCGECGWLLYQAPRAGAVTAAMRGDFDARLRAARQHQIARDARTLEAELRDVIGGLHPGTPSTVIDVGADQVTVTTAYLDAAGSPQVRESGSVAWTSVLRTLATAERARHAQLADGIDGLGDDTVAGLLRDHMPPVRDGRVLVVCRPAGWRVLEAAVMALAARPHRRLLRISGASGDPVREQLADLAAKAPLRHSYRLMTAVVDGRTGRVALRPRELFTVGAQPGTEANMTLRRSPGDVSDMALAIFVDTGNLHGADGASADPLALFSVPLPAGSAPRLRAVLDGPGRVRIIEPPGAIPHTSTWAQVRGQIPRQVTTATAPVDLVCGIDLAGSRDAVRQRTGLVRELIELVAAAYPGEHSLRVGVVTCTEHVFGRRPGAAERDPVTSVSDVGPAAEALEWLRKTKSADIRYPPCVPVEDLLEESLALLAGSRRAGRVPLLLTVAGRRPHPHHQQLDDRLPCPRRLMWQHLMDQLTRQAGVRCAVVADALPRGAAGEEWRRLGPAGQRVLSGTTARQVAEDLGLLAAQTQRIPLPLTDDPEGATR